MLLPFSQTEIDHTTQFWIKVLESVLKLIIYNSYHHFTAGETEILWSKAAQGHTVVCPKIRNQKSKLPAPCFYQQQLAVKSLLKELACV